MNGLKTFTLLLTVSLCLLPHPGLTQTTDAATPAAAKRLEVSLSKPTVLNFAGLTKIKILDSEIASAMFLSDDRIAIEGRNPGTTTVELYRLVGEEEQAEIYEVVVSDNAAATADTTTDTTATDTTAATDTAADTTTDTTTTQPITVPVTADAATTDTSTDTTATDTTAATDTATDTTTDTTTTQPTTVPVTADTATTDTSTDTTTTDTTAVTDTATDTTTDITTTQPTTVPVTADAATTDTTTTDTATTDTTTTDTTATDTTTTDTAAMAANEPSLPSLYLQLSVDQEESAGSMVLSYAIAVGNRGPVPATEIIVRDVLPNEVSYVPGSVTEGGRYNELTRELEWQLPRLAPGEDLPQTLGFKVKLAEGASLSTTVHNVATAECKELETMIASNTTSHKVQVSALMAIFALPDVILAKKQIAMPLLDVRGEEYRRAVDRLEGLGIVHGYPDRTFVPDAHVNRAESTKMVVLAANLKEFRDRTRLTFVLQRAAKVTAALLDSSGQVVRTLLKDEQRAAGDHGLTWDGADDDGVPVPAGAYEYVVTATDLDGHQTKLASNLTVVPVQDVDIKGAPTFKDVQPVDWYAGYVAEAENRQYVRGYPDGSFRPKRKLTRAEATAIVIRALGMEKQAEDRSTAETGFLDKEDIPEWANGYIAVASTQAPKAGDQLIIGYPGNTFQPRKLIKRTEAAAMVERFIDRDVSSEVTVAGATSPGASLTLNGRVVRGGPHGQFRERVSVLPGQLTTIAVLMK